MGQPQCVAQLPFDQVKLTRRDPKLATIHLDALARCREGDREEVRQVAIAQYVQLTAWVKLTRSRVQLQQGVSVPANVADISFGCNGFRLGVIISPHNPLVIRALLHIAFLAKCECRSFSRPSLLQLHGSLCQLTPVGSIGDALISHLINDKPVFESLVAKNVDALRASSEKMAAWCEKQGWKPVPVNSGHFMMVHARNLGFQSMDEEKEFGRHCVEYGVGVVSGTVQGEGLSVGQLAT